MKVLVAGASGLVGSSLVPFLENEGCKVYRLVRKLTNGLNEILWDPATKQLDVDACEGFDAFINLAGDPIAKGRWNPEKKKRIFESRIKSTELLAATIQKLKQKPSVWINASAIGYYGETGAATVSEASPQGVGFLAEVCQAWEAATLPAENGGVRVVKLRFGVILSSFGGALKEMMLPFKMGLGGVIGSGDQYMSWISLEDVLEIIMIALTNKSYSGAINVVTENPVTNREFTKTLGAVLHRPTILPMPAFAARLVFGEVADALLLSSCRAKPEKLLSYGYRFKNPTLKDALF